MAHVQTVDLNAPWQRDTLLQLRTSKMKQMHNLSITTGIYKLPRTERVWCSSTGLESDEHDLTFHGGLEKAVHQYYPGHYASWRREFPEGQNFDVGSFGENLVSEKMNERNVCVGDKIRVGEALLQVFFNAPSYVAHSQMAKLSIQVFGARYRHSRCLAPQALVEKLY
jgi:hypothetical protein